MKFLLAAFNAKYIHSNPAIYSLKAYAGKQYAKHIELAEYTINHSFHDILADIFDRKPDVIGLSCYIWNVSLVTELIPEIHKLLPDTQIWLGGPEVSFECHKMFEKYPFLTGIMVGEGEGTFLDLLKYYLGEGDRRLTEIEGLALPTGYTKERGPMDFSELPFLYTVGDAYSLDDFSNRIIYYESSRGCPYRCSYCLSSIDKKLRLRDISPVKKELQFFLEQKVPQVKFIDRTFNCNHEHAKEIWQFILNNDNGVTNFHFEIAADLLDEEEIALLSKMRPGLVQLEIGVQTTNPDTLQEIRRVTNMTKLKEVVAKLQAGRNIHLHLDLIAGLPYEDYESFARSFSEVYEMKPEQLQLGFLKVLKGSYMAEKAAEYGLSYLEKAPFEVLYTNWISFHEVKKLKEIEEMVEIYYNSNQFTHTLPLLLKKFARPFDLFEAIATFYRENGYFLQAPARSYKYQVLLDFAVSIDEEHQALYRESLTFDLFLRENAKSRPSFSANIEVHKGDFHQFFKNEEMVRSYLPHYEKYDVKQISKMTHLEWFHYPVWEMGNGTQLPQEKKVLFDYQERSPLTNEAKIYVLD